MIFKPCAVSWSSITSTSPEFMNNVSASVGTVPVKPALPMSALDPSGMPLLVMKAKFTYSVP